MHHAIQVALSLESGRNRIIRVGDMLGDDVDADQDGR